MRHISSELIIEKVKRITIKANTELREDVLTALKKISVAEKKCLARNALSAIVENAKIAAEKKMAICQDTGFPVIFLELGSKVCLDENITQVINRTVKQVYKSGCLRASIQQDPLFRDVAAAYEPIIVHTDIVSGDKIKITILLKGFGSENKSRVRMFTPTASLSDIENFIIESVEKSGASACPPYVIGIGIGGTQDFACLLSKKALLRPVIRRNQKRQIAKMEENLFKKVNRLKIGPFGFGGGNTALAVNIEVYPTHIAGLPVAVNLSCHALRSASVTI